MMQNNFRTDLRHAIARNNAEKPSNTPDYVLEEFLMTCLAAFNEAFEKRKQWYTSFHFQQADRHYDFEPVEADWLQQEKLAASWPIGPQYEIALRKVVVAWCKEAGCDWVFREVHDPVRLWCIEISTSPDPTVLKGPGALDVWRQTARELKVGPWKQSWSVEGAGSE